MRLAPLRFENRARVAELLVATAAFSSEEVAVALELFDTCHPAGASPDAARGVNSASECGRPLAGSLQSTRQEPSTGEGKQIPTLASLLRDDTSADYEFVGAFDDEGVLLGYASFGPTPATEGTYDLYWLAVDPAAQGRGAGRALVRWVEQELGQRGARLLVVETSSRADYSHTREFYARGGYAEAARVRDFYAPADDRIILTTRVTTREGGVATQ